MKVLVCGSRKFANPFLASRVIYDEIAALPADTHVIHGAAVGTDSIAADFAAKLGLHVEPFPVRRGEYPLRRNDRMLDENPDRVLAFWNGKSGGTAYTVREAAKRGIRYYVVHVKDDTSGISPGILDAP